MCHDVYNDVEKTDGDRIIHRDRVIEKREFTKEREKKEVRTKPRNGSKSSGKILSEKMKLRTKVREILNEELK